MEPRGTVEIRLEHISRRFGAELANDGVDFLLKPGTVHALVGENGAGKSTLMRVLYGLLRPHAGRILLDDQPAEIPNPAVALSRGIGMIHQHFMLVPVMTVLENIVLGTPNARGLGTLPRAGLAVELAELFARYRFDLDPLARIDQLSVGGRQRVEIARLLYRGARVLICDEPTAVLAPPEVAAFFDILRRFRDEGRSIVLVTHKLSEVLEIADEVTVLRRGRVVGHAPRAEVDRDLLVRWIVGERGERGSKPASVRAERVRADVPPAAVMEAQGLTVRDADGRRRVDRVSFSLARGEILGIAGVAGNGQSELAEAVSGRLRFTGGRLKLGDRSFAPNERIPLSARPAFIPEDRCSQGLIPEFRLWENLLLGRLDEADFMRPGWYSHASARLWAQPLLAEYRVEPERTELGAQALSGGNQQKLLCAREMSRGKPILVACQPTRGIDLGSTAFLHEILRDFCRGGGAVLLISTDLEEVFSLADRVAVIYRGQLGPPHPTAEVGLEQIGREMVGLSAQAAAGDTPHA